jgi:glutamate-1-semialdehyde 2,1-aminomutase
VIVEFYPDERACMNTSPNGRNQRLGRSAAVSEELSRLIPGGSHTCAKGEDQYPDGLAPVVSHGSGAQVWDIDGDRYIEYGSGLRAVALDHGRREVVAAARGELERGTNFVRSRIVELDPAEAFLETVRARRWSSSPPRTAPM